MSAELSQEGKGEQQHCQPLFYSQPSLNGDAEKTKLKISLLSPSAFHASLPEVGEWQLQGKHHLLLQQGAGGSKAWQNRCSLSIHRHQTLSPNSKEDFFYHNNLCTTVSEQFPTVWFLSKKKKNLSDHFNEHKPVCHLLISVSPGRITSCV